MISILLHITKHDLVFGVRLIISKCTCMLYASGKLSLVVLTTEKGDAFAFDVKKHPDIMYQGLGRVLQSVHVLKVKTNGLSHQCRRLILGADSQSHTHAKTHSPKIQ